MKLFAAQHMNLRGQSICHSKAICLTGQSSILHGQHSSDCMCRARLPSTFNIGGSNRTDILWAYKPIS